ncbi:hypothetical protein BDV27DRAFT_131794 [Aspergillus caelatus]|uniref:Uncharacterized protein n=2 Tax=Aspergillus subgen. Circumdati TaxID=2720871 RepID=A0A5N6ZY18_9EURO|nr:uncharacterized protein BDV27DRAFT_131794 [Aspergillus caelatus]KAE8362268.1 hypothetical protein BDV27DRAFT_131794 [Aspergillus caelatus]KAE8419734.1 hypothetical protein BDV36DRAFT_250736 [Aspergillus pseudocaelatus]
MYISEVRSPGSERWISFYLFKNDVKQAERGYLHLDMADLEQKSPALPMQSQAPKSSGYPVLDILHILEEIRGHKNTLSASDRRKVQEARTIVEEQGLIGNKRDFHVAGLMTFIRATQPSIETGTSLWGKYKSSEFWARAETRAESWR